MSDTSNFGFGKFVPGFDFLQSLAKGASSSIPQLPNHLVEWEIKRIAKVGRRALPAGMREWSEPLPPDQWAKPSAESMRLSANVKALKKRSPRLSITDVFAQVYAREKAETGKPNCHD